MESTISNEDIFNSEIHEQIGDSSPDVLLLSSNLKPFVKEVDSVLCLNVGHLSKSTGGGTYAHLVVHPPKEAEGSSEGSGIASRVKVDIVRI